MRSLLHEAHHLGSDETVVAGPELEHRHARIGAFHLEIEGFAD